MSTGILVSLIGAYVIGHAIYGDWAKVAWNAISGGSAPADTTWKPNAKPGKPGGGQGGGGGGAW
jgi:hypothetical protein